MTLAVLTAVLEGRRRTDLEAMIGAELPWSWPSRALVEQAFRASLEAVVANPEKRLWGDRLMITREEKRRVVGSVVFHGRPGQDGECEIAFGVDDSCQRQGFANEAVQASLEWAFAQPECRVVVAKAMRWDKGSLKLLAKLGMVRRAVQPPEDVAKDTIVFEKLRATP